MKRIGKFVIATLVFAAVAGLSGFAYAYWTAPGTGSAVATTGTMTTVTILGTTTAADAGSSKLHPGATADVVLRVHNPNPFAVHVVSVTSPGGITGSGGVGSCPTPGVTFTSPSTVADIPPGDSTVVLAGAASMLGTSSSGCQGATFQIPVTLTVKA